MRSPAAVVCAFLLVGVAGCGGGDAGKGAAGSSGGDHAGAITAFAKGGDALVVDKVGGADGALSADGQPDASFTATVTGPVLSLLLVETDAAGTPSTDWQWDTLVGTQTMPPGIRTAVKRGADTGGLGVFENGKALNGTDGSLPLLPAGPHDLVIYASNAGAFSPGDHFRLYAERPDHTVVAGPIALF